MSVREVVIKLVGDSSQIEPTVKELERLGLVDKKNAQQFQKTSQTATKGLRNTQAEAKKVKASFSDMQVSVKSLAGALGLAFGAQQAFTFVKDLIKDSAKAAIEFEQLNVSFETFLGSAELAKKVLGELEQFSMATPFTPDQVNQAGRALLAFGIENEKLIGTLKTVGDVAAGTGKDFNELSVIYGKARTQGTLFAEDINQLTEAGVPIIQEFAKQFGVTEGEVKKLGSQGKISFDNLEQAFVDMTSEGGRFFDLMEKQSQTVGGRISTLEGNIDALKKEIGQELLPVVGDVVEISDDLIKALRGSEDASAGATASISVLRVVWEAIITPLRLAWEWQVNLTKAWINAGVWVGDLIEKVEDFAFNAVNSFINGVNGMINTINRAITASNDLLGTSISQIDTLDLLRRTYITTGDGARDFSAETEAAAEKYKKSQEKQQSANTETAKTLETLKAELDKLNDTFSTTDVNDKKALQNTARLILAKQKEIEAIKALLKTQKESNEEEKRAAIDVEKFKEETTKERIANLENEQKRLLAIRTDALREGVLTEQQFQEISLQSEIEALETKLEIQRGLGQESVDTELELANKRLEIQRFHQEESKKIQEQELEFAKINEEAKRGMQEASVNLATSSVNTHIELLNQRTNAEIQNLEKELEHRRELGQDTTQIEEEIAKKRASIAQRMNAISKALLLFEKIKEGKEVVISTAAAIAKARAAAAPFLANPLTAAPASATLATTLARLKIGAALSLATIAATTIPELTVPAFAKGTSKAPGGTALVGEKGPELVTLPKGAAVFNHTATRAIDKANQGDFTDLWNMSFSTPDIRGNRQEKGLDYDRMEGIFTKSIENAPFSRLNIDERGFTLSQIKKNQQINYLNKRYST